MAELFRFEVIRNVVLSLLLVGACGCDRDAATAPSSTSASIHGRVLDFHSQSPLTGAVVEFTADQQSGESRATTDASGAYEMTVRGGGTFTVSVDRALVGTARVSGAAYRGDLLIDRGTCISRYGTLADARTLRPVSGATVAIGTHSAVSGADGWYRIDLGCPSVPDFPSTALISVTHSSFAPYQQMIGRGVQGVRRIDIHLEKQ